MDFLEKTDLLFDLDGTLTDPGDGITHSVQHALRFFGMDAEREKLLCFIGPPLTESFEKYFHFTPEKAAMAVSKYREYFSEKGIFENVVYDGMEAFLKTLKENGKRLFVATSKPEPFAKKILAHFGLLSYFTGVAGSGLDGSLGQKWEVIQKVLKDNRISPENALMIGDREHDVLGAKRKGIPAVGVLYGYGGQEELENAGAAAVAKDLCDLTRLLLCGSLTG